MAKTWQEKLDGANQKGPIMKMLDKDAFGMKSGQNMLIATPQMLLDVIETIPSGGFMELMELRAALADKKGADVTCPVTTGIFLRMIVEVAHEDHENGASMSEIPPFWRAVNAKTPLSKKVDFDLTPYFAMHEIEINAA